MHFEVPSVVPQTAASKQFKEPNNNQCQNRNYLFHFVYKIQNKTISEDILLNT